MPSANREQNGVPYDEQAIAVQAIPCESIGQLLQPSFCSRQQSIRNTVGNRVVVGTCELTQLSQSRGTFEGTVLRGCIVATSCVSAQHGGSGAKQLAPAGQQPLQLRPQPFADSAA